MQKSSRYSRSEVDLYKSGSTMSLFNDTSLKVMLNSRSSRLLLSRGSSFPAHSLDLSADLANENLSRRTLHKKILDTNPCSFRKMNLPESASGTVHQQQINKDLLGEMHPLQDFGDINKSRTYTRSRKLEKDMLARTALDEYHFKTMKPMEDFVRPDSPITPRQTGYESGHIRSRLKLDTYGPANSDSVNKLRDSGIVPPSPNVDRHKLINPSYQLRPASSSSTNHVRCDHTALSSNESSTNYDGAFPSLRKLRGVQEKFRQELHEKFNKTNPHRKLLKMNNVKEEENDYNFLMNTENNVQSLHSRVNTPKSIGTSTLGGANSITGRTKSGKYLPQTFAGRVFTPEERELGDSFLRRTMWSKSYVNLQKEIQKNKEQERKDKQYLNHQKNLALEENINMDKFDDYLVLAKFQS